MNGAATIDPASGTERDFTNSEVTPVIYTVTTELGDKIEFKVTVIVDPEWVDEHEFTNVPENLDITLKVGEADYVSPIGITPSDGLTLTYVSDGPAFVSIVDGNKLHAVNKTPAGQPVHVSVTATKEGQTVPLVGPTLNVTVTADNVFVNPDNPDDIIKIMFINVLGNSPKLKLGGANYAPTVQVVDEETGAVLDGVTINYVSNDTSKVTVVTESGTNAKKLHPVAKTTTPVAVVVNAQKTGYSDTSSDSPLMVTVTDDGIPNASTDDPDVNINPSGTTHNLILGYWAGDAQFTPWVYHVDKTLGTASGSGENDDRIDTIANTLTKINAEYSAKKASWPSVDNASLVLHGNTTFRTQKLAVWIIIHGEQKSSVTGNFVNITGANYPPLLIQGGSEGGSLNGNNQSRVVSLTGGAIVEFGQFLTITGGKTSGEGGGAYIGGSTTLLLVSGATIDSNENSSPNGGGGAGIRDNGWLVMNSGMISANKSTGSTGTGAGDGGGFYAWYGNYIMEGGSIKKNRVVDNGGGFYIDTGIFVKNGGVIYGANSGENRNQAGVNFTTGASSSTKGGATYSFAGGGRSITIAGTDLKYDTLTNGVVTSFNNNTAALTAGS
jgi:hypothetical protein